MPCMLCTCHKSQCSLVLQLIEVERVNTFMAVIAQVANAQVLKCHIRLHNTSELIRLPLPPLPPPSIFWHLNNISKKPQVFKLSGTREVPYSLYHYLKGRGERKIQKGICFFSPFFMFSDHSRVWDVNNSFDVVCILKQNFSHADIF